MRISFIIQYSLFGIFLLTYFVAITNAQMLIQWYEFFVPQNSLKFLEYKGGHFTQASAHSALTIISVAIIYLIALVNVPKYFRQQPIKWNGQYVTSLTDKLNDVFFSKILIPPFASYLESSFSKVYKPVKLSAENNETLPIPVALLRYLFSKPSLSMIAFELVVVSSLWILSRDVGVFRFFTFNTISFFFGAGVVFKVLLIIMASRYSNKQKGDENG